MQGLTCNYTIYTGFSSLGVDNDVNNDFFYLKLKMWLRRLITTHIQSFKLIHSKQGLTCNYTIYTGFSSLCVD